MHKKAKKTEKQKARPLEHPLIIKKCSIRQEESAVLSTVTFRQSVTPQRGVEIVVKSNNPLFSLLSSFVVVAIYLPDNRMALSSTLFFSDRKKINIRNSKTKALILKYFACTLLQPNRKLTYQNIIIIKLIND